MKTRYAKPFESVQVEIPYETGMSSYSGLVEFFEAKGALKKSGTRLEYTSPTTGEVITQFRKVWDRNENQCLDLLWKNGTNSLKKFRMQWVKNLLHKPR